MMKKQILSLMLLISTITIANAQTGNVGINTTTPNPDAVLDVVSTNRGILNPRVALQSTTLATPLSAHVAGMVVYNTATTGDVVPALYYNDGTQWVKSSGSGGAPSTAAMNVTYQTGNYTALATDDIILYTTPGTAPTLTLPTTGVTVGKRIYVSIIGGSNLNINPAVREVSTNSTFNQVTEGQGAIFMYTGDAASPWSTISGY